MCTLLARPVFGFRKALWEKTHRVAVTLHWYTLSRCCANCKVSLYKMAGAGEISLPFVGLSNIKPINITHLFYREEIDADQLYHSLSVLIIGLTL